MTRREFQAELKKRLAAVPKEERSRTLDYYDEMIYDRMEEGMSEIDAVAALGDIDIIAAEILSTCKSKGSCSVNPLKWLCGIFLAVLLPVMLIILWTLVLSVAIALASCAVTAVAGVAYAPFAYGTSPIYFLLVLGTALVSGGLTLALIPAIIVSCRGAAKLSAASARFVKRLIVRR